jgi:hypothetical protein
MERETASAVVAAVVALFHTEIDIDNSSICICINTTASRSRVLRRLSINIKTSTSTNTSTSTCHHGWYGVVYFVSFIDKNKNKLCSTQHNTTQHNTINNCQAQLLLL